MYHTSLTAQAVALCLSLGIPVSLIAWSGTCNNFLEVREVAKLGRIDVCFFGSGEEARSRSDIFDNVTFYWNMDCPAKHEADCFLFSMANGVDGKDGNYENYICKPEPKIS
jgi:hypothetical protein